jgi:hypothetical protein
MKVATFLAGLLLACRAANLAQATSKGIPSYTRNSIRTWFDISASRHPTLQHAVAMIRETGQPPDHKVAAFMPNHDATLTGFTTERANTRPVNIGRSRAAQLKRKENSMKYPPVLLTAVFLVSMGIASQAQDDCPPVGCNCSYFNGLYDDVNQENLSQTLQHYSGGNHNATYAAAVSCDFVDGSKQPDGLYKCADSGVASTHVTTGETTGDTSPTYIGHMSPTVHRISTSAQACTISGNGEISLSTTGVISVTECYTGDGLCLPSSMTFMFGNCSQNVTYTDHLGQYGSVLWQQPFVTPLSCPYLEAPGPSPIIIPLNGGDFSDAFTDSSNDSVLFPLRTGQQPQAMAWIAKDAPYGFLVLDRNGNDKIDALDEMFGNFTHQPMKIYPHDTERPYEPNGFHALSYFDAVGHGGNNDGVLSKDDEVWSLLRVWVDTCHCGQSQFGKLYTLDELGITTLGLRFVKAERQDRYGNKLKFKGFMVQNGRQVTVYDVFFRPAP